MLMDKEKNRIQLSSKPNGHLLVLGKSGMGKTFYICRKVEEEVENGHFIMLFDFSSSYSNKELERANFKYLDKIDILNPMQDKILLTIDESKLTLTILDALIKALHIGSYYQKNLLKEAIETVKNRSNIISLTDLKYCLEDMDDEDRDTDSKKSIAHLLTRLEPYSDIENIIFSGEKDKPGIDHDKLIMLLQLSDFSELQRKFLTVLLSEIVWEQIRTKWWLGVDIVIFDEFQFMSIKTGTGLSSMLREGRKFGLAVYLSSQFVGNYDVEEMDTLMQCGNILFFRPAVRDIKKTADMISLENPIVWKRILEELQVGEAILKGVYTINGTRKLLEDPVICCIM